MTESIGLPSFGAMAEKGGLRRKGGAALAGAGDETGWGGLLVRGGGQ